MNTNFSSYEPRGYSAGFTLVEAVVTLTILALFLTLFFQAYQGILSQQGLLRKRTVADMIATSNLRKFTVRPLKGAAALNCSDIPSTGSGLKIGDSLNPSLSTTYNFQLEDASKLPGSTQEVYVSAPYGCDAPRFSQLPLKIVSVVTYDTASGARVVHASYVK